MDLLYILVSVVLLETTYLTYQQFAKHEVKSPRSRIVCDTSALIDGRIVAIARSGFLSSELVVPRSVTRELQYMADRADHDKRERARYGLDVVNELQSIDQTLVTIYDDGDGHPDGVDEQLLQLAKKLGARLCTTDYNLNKVARTEQVTVVNVNELAHALRPMHLPGEVIELQIVAAGQNKDQGVGYLDDGTMVVIDRAKSQIGRTVQAETTRVLQTEAGRMVFARLQGDRPDKPEYVQKRSQSKYRRTGAPKQVKHTQEDRLVDLANQ
ncbi:MAG: TRAM domain-containing protein [Candidatus Saccharimonadales bacterium]